MSDDRKPGLTFGDISEPIAETADELIELTVKVPRRTELDRNSQDDIFAMNGVGSGAYRELLEWRKEG